MESTSPDRRSTRRSTRRRSKGDLKEEVDLRLSASGEAKLAQIGVNHVFIPGVRPVRYRPPRKRPRNRWLVLDDARSYFADEIARHGSLVQASGFSSTTRLLNDDIRRLKLRFPHKTNYQLERALLASMPQDAHSEATPDLGTAAALLTAKDSDRKSNLRARKLGGVEADTALPGPRPETRAAGSRAGSRQSLASSSLRTPHMGRVSLADQQRAGGSSSAASGGESIQKHPSGAPALEGLRVLLQPESISSSSTAASSDPTTTTTAARARAASLSAGSTAGESTARTHSRAESSVHARGGQRGRAASGSIQSPSPALSFVSLGGAAGSVLAAESGQASSGGRSSVWNGRRLRSKARHAPAPMQLPPAASSSSSCSSSSSSSSGPSDSRSSSGALPHALPKRSLPARLACKRPRGSSAGNHRQAPGEAADGDGEQPGDGDPSSSEELALGGRRPRAFRRVQGGQATKVSSKLSQSIQPIAPSAEEGASDAAWVPLAQAVGQTLRLRPRGPCLPSGIQKRARKRRRTK